jgi:hypothetical protein
MVPQFVDYIPEQLEPGVLYVSLEFATSSHVCACGCGAIAVTPLSRVGWKMIFDGTVSLFPSIGMWSFPCRSHYWIKENGIVWASQWTMEEIDSARRLDAFQTASYFEKSASEHHRNEGNTSIEAGVPVQGQATQGLLRWIKGKLFRR